MLTLKLCVVLVCLAMCRAEDGIEEDEEEDEEPRPQCAIHYAHLDRSKDGIEYEFKHTKDGYYYHHKKYTPGSFPDISDHSETGTLVNRGTNNEEFVVIGRYSYKVFRFELVVMYTAGKDGYRPKIFWKKFPCGVAVSPSVKLLQNLSG